MPLFLTGPTPKAPDPILPLVQLQQDIDFDQLFSIENVSPVFEVPLVMDPVNAMPLLSDITISPTLSFESLSSHGSEKKRKLDSLSRQELIDQVDLRRQKNTESARRSRERKRQELTCLKTELDQARAVIESMQKRIKLLEEENARLKQ